jgi:hypothetical protein
LLNQQKIWPSQVENFRGISFSLLKTRVMLWINCSVPYVQLFHSARFAWIVNCSVNNCFEVEFVFWPRIIMQFKNWCRFYKMWRTLHSLQRASVRAGNWMCENGSVKRDMESCYKQRHELWVKCQRVQGHAGLKWMGKEWQCRRKWSEKCEVMRSASLQVHQVTLPKGEIDQARPILCIAGMSYSSAGIFGAL